MRHFPNQGIRRTQRNSALLALISCVLIAVIEMQYHRLSAGLLIGLYYWQIKGQSYEIGYGISYTIPKIGPSVGLILAVCGGLLVFASRGGLAVLRHYVIRLLLARSHVFPWQAVRFLDDATTRIFLRRVGGGYSFTHRLLLDYFADLDAAEAATHPVTTPVTNITPPSPNDASAAQ